VPTIPFKLQCQFWTHLGCLVDDINTASTFFDLLPLLLRQIIKGSTLHTQSDVIELINLFETGSTRLLATITQHLALILTLLLTFATMFNDHLS
jgi:hypothetical protein